MTIYEDRVNMKKLNQVAREDIKNIYRLPGYETKIYKSEDLTAYFYFDTCIAAARIAEDVLFINNGGWYTLTTKKRINKILEYYNIPWSLYQKTKDNVIAWYLYNNCTKETYKFFGQAAFQVSTKEPIRLA